MAAAEAAAATATEIMSHTIEAAPPVLTPRRERAWWRRHDVVAYLYLIPALAFYVFFLLRPIGESIWISFFDWDGITEGSWAGFENFIKVVTNPEIGESILHSFVFIVFYAGFPIVLALGVVGIISRFRVRALTFFRAALFVPYILSQVVVAIAWQWIFAESGPLNSLLRAVGLDGVTRSWLGDFATALPAVGFIGTWTFFGLAFILFVSGIQKIPAERYEAARLDGAGPVREFFSVTFPALRGEIQVALVLLITAALRNFDIVWNTTSGGPGHATSVPSFLIYHDAFVKHEVGQASAIAVVLTVIILITVALVMRLVRPDEEAN